MNLKNFDYNVERTENCVLVDVTNWLDNTSSTLKTYHMTGKDHVNYMTKVLATNVDKSKFNEEINIGDSVLLTRIVCDVARYRAHALNKEKKYYDVPVMQIIGKFRDNNVSLDALEPMYDKLIMEKLEPEYSKVLVTPNDNSMVCKVLKAGTRCFDKNWNEIPMTAKAGDVVLVRDNVTTEVELDGSIYYATEESMIVGIFNDPNNLSLDTMTFINGSILMREFIEERALDSVLLTPELNYDMLDYSDIYNRDKFKVAYVDKNLTKVNQGDILLVNRDITNYVYFNLEKFFVLNGTEFIEGKVIE